MYILLIVVNDIQFSIAMSFLKKKKISPNIVKIIKLREIKSGEAANYIDYKLLDLKRSYLDTSSFSHLYKSVKVLKRKQLRKIDAIIEEYIEGNEFTLMIPHSYFDLIDIIATHPKCMSIYLVEEGAAAYRKDLTPKLFIKSIRPYNFFKSLGSLLLSKRFLSGPDFYPSEKYIDGVVSLDERAFPFIKSKKKTILPPSEVFEFIPELQKKYGSSLIFSIEKQVINGVINMGDYSSALKNLAYDLKRNHFYTINFTVHPSISPQSEFCNSVINIFAKEGLQTYLIEHNMHSLFYSCNDIKFINLNTSLYIYAKLCGVECYSWLNYIGTTSIKSRFILGRLKKSLDFQIPVEELFGR